jgi:subtilase family serine protease
LHHVDAPRARRRRGLVLLGACALASSVICLGAAAAHAATAARVELPSPNAYAVQGTPAPLSDGKQVNLRVYLAGQHASDLASAALAVSTPGNPSYGHYLTPAQYQQHYGSSATQVKAVTDWVTAAGMKVTVTTSHYIAVHASVGQADKAFDTVISQYNTIYGAIIGASGKFSVPAAVGADIATVTGLAETTTSGSAAPRRSVTVRSSAGAQAAGYQCSQYWGQHVEKMPAAYGRTTAPTQLCGYTPQQIRKAYGVTGSKYTGKGVTVGIVLNEAWPTMLHDANRFFASRGVPGFAPGQYTQSLDSHWASTCGVDQRQPGIQPDPEEALDVETTHMAAPEAKVVLVGADCVPITAFNPPLELQYNLDANTRIVDHHLADVVSSSWGYGPNAFSPADVVAWNRVFQQGALEGIGFNYSSGDGGSIGPAGGLSTSAQFPAADPWVTSVGGTSIAIGKNGTAVADYPWGDNVAQANAAGTGYTTPLPGVFQGGSGGGVSALFAQPGYQHPVVPTSLATGGGKVTARRVVPDVSANAGSNWWIGYTGAVTKGVYAQVICGGTSGSTPLTAGLEADAIQADGHPLGFANPALYKLYRTPAIRSVPAVSGQHPPVVYGGSIFYNGDDYLTTLGEDQPPLKSTGAYNDVTGLGAETPSFSTAFRQFG